MKQEIKQEIEAETTQYKKNDKLLQHLLGVSSNSFTEFLNSLRETEQGHIANLLTGETEEGMTVQNCNFYEASVTIFFLNIFQDCIQPFGHAMLS